MATSKIPISGSTPIGTADNTPGPRGLRDSGKPRAGDTPGPTGHNDKGDPAFAADLPLRDLWLEYRAIDADMLKFTIVSAAPIAGSKTLARHGDSLLLHGNNRIVVHAQGRPLTWAPAIYRVFRVWSAPLDPETEQRAGRYTTGGSTKWTNDGSGGTNWVDVPGVKVSRDASARRSERSLIEFLVGVLNHPEAGGLYFHVMVDVLPGKFRVSMSRELAFDGMAWTKLFPFGFDFRATQSASGTQDEVIVSTVIDKPFADEDGGLPIVLDYRGWTKLP